MPRILLSLAVVLCVSGFAFGNAPAPEPAPVPVEPPRENPKPATEAMSATLKVTKGKAATTKILIPKKFAQAAGAATDVGDTKGSGFWLSAAAVRTIIGGVFLSCAAIASLVLLRKRQTKLATASLMVFAASLGVMGSSIANVPEPFREREVPMEPASVVIEYVDGDTVTIVMGTDFPK